MPRDYEYFTFQIVIYFQYEIHAYMPGVHKTHAAKSMCTLPNKHALRTPFLYQELMYLLNPNMNTDYWAYI